MTCADTRSCSCVVISREGRPSSSRLVRHWSHPRLATRPTSSTRPATRKHTYVPFLACSVPVLIPYLVRDQLPERLRHLGINRHLPLHRLQRSHHGPIQLVLCLLNGHAVRRSRVDVGHRYLDRRQRKHDRDPDAGVFGGFGLPRDVDGRGGCCGWCGVEFAIGGMGLEACIEVL